MDILLMPLMAMGLAFIVAPFLALVPTIIFIFIYKRSKCWPVLLAAILWGIYAIYETGMYLRILCTGECNIRIDLLIIYPLLIFVSLFAVVFVIKWKKRDEA